MSALHPMPAGACAPLLAGAVPAFRVLAQDMFSSRRIAKVVSARTADDALLLTGPELHDAGFYAIDVKGA